MNDEGKGGKTKKWFTPLNKEFYVDNPVTVSTVTEFNKVRNFLESRGEDPNTVSVSDALKEFEKTAIPAYIEDKMFYRSALQILGIVIVLTLIGIIGLAATGKTIPEGLIAIGSTAVGVFAGLFATNNLKK